MTISKFRSWLYFIAKYLGDLQALRSPRKGAVKKRVKRRILGKLFGRTIGKLVK